jgi:hypothetical protein
LAANTYVVVVQHNLVTEVRKESDAVGIVVPQTKLEVGTQLADNYRVHGCIDGNYYFDNPQRARIFATLCLEFTRGLIEKRLDAVKQLSGDAEYRAIVSSGSPES